MGGGWILEMCDVVQVEIVGDGRMMFGVQGEVRVQVKHAIDQSNEECVRQERHVDRERLSRLTTVAFDQLKGSMIGDAEDRIIRTEMANTVMFGKCTCRWHCRSETKADRL